MSDLPVTLPDPLARQLAVAFDVEGKIPRALDNIIAGDRLLRPSNNSLQGWT